jgi:multiple sugar transport system permease protein
MSEILDITKSEVKLVGQRKLKTTMKQWWKKNGVGYMFLAPYLILFLIFIVIPVVIAFSMSVTNYNMIQKPKFVGLTNFKILFMDDDVFLIALKNTLIFACITGPIGYIMSFLAAWVISNLKARNAFALAFYAPSLTSGIAMSVVWLYFFSGDRYGLINNFLINTLGVMQEPILWNKDPKYILPVVILISVWMSMGTGFLVFLAGLQNISPELYEAGAIDGIKNKFQQLWYITLPLMQPQLLFGAVNSIVGSFGAYDIAVQVAGMPSPNYSAHTIVAHLFDHAFIRFNMGYASAVAVVLFVMTYTLGRVCMRAFKSRE